MRLFKYFAALALLLAIVSPALADVALPEKTRDAGLGGVRRDLPYSQMTIERVEGLREARLQIPRAQFTRVAASAGIEQTGGAALQSGVLKGFGTVVAGLFLSLAVVLTGMLLVRARRGVAAGRAAAAVLVCVCGAGLAAVAAYANAGLPEWQAQDPGTLIKAVSGKPLTGSIRIEVVEEGREIKLLVPAKAQRAGEEEE
jgi:hypothetical protein